MIRKDLIIAILATFCLTTTLFLIIPTRSQTIGNYDPWLDTNADGKIDGKDLGAAAYAFGSGGDPTKDVNVTNWPSATNITDSDFAWSDFPYIPPSGSWMYTLSTVGFRQVTVKVTTSATVYVELIQNLHTPQGGATTMKIDTRNVNYEFTKTYNIVGTCCDIVVYNYGSSAAQVTCFVYMNSIPSIETDPTYDNQYVNVNSSSTLDTFFDCGGYSRMAISVVGGYGSYSPLDWNATLCLYCIYWENSWEYLSHNYLNVTINVHNGFANIPFLPPPFITETKANYCTLWWMFLSTYNAPPNWWMTFTVNAYFRNE
jgi:hypothetical protein